MGERTGKKTAEGWTLQTPDQPGLLEGVTDTCQWAWSRGSAAEPSSCWFVKMTQWLGDPGGPRCTPMSRWVCEYHLSST